VRTPRFLQGSITSRSQGEPEPNSKAPKSRQKLGGRSAFTEDSPKPVLNEASRAEGRYYDRFTRRKGIRSRTIVVTRQRP